MRPDQRNQTLDRLRTSAPIYRDPELNCVVLSRYGDVRRLLLQDHLKDPDIASPPTPFTRTVAQALAKPTARREMGSMDAPDHPRVRGVVVQALRRRVSDARPAIERIVEARLEILSRRDTFDLVEDFCAPVSIAVIYELVGVDPADVPEGRSWAQAIFAFFKEDRSDNENSAQDLANAAFSRLMLQTLETLRRRPGDNLASDLLAAQAAGADLSDKEIADNLIGFLVSGTNTTTDLVSTTAWLLLSHPDQLARLKQEPTLVENAVEEALRLEAPIESEWRVLAQDLELDGCPIKAGEVVAVSLSAANHDPGTYIDPHSFEITRRVAPHASFGFGAHACAGAPLARLEARVCISKLFARFPNLRMLHGSDDPAWRDHPHFRGLERLQVRI